MIKIENGEVSAEGSAIELTKEWGMITEALCRHLSEATGYVVDIPLLTKSVRDLLKMEKEILC